LEKKNIQKAFHQQERSPHFSNRGKGERASSRKKIETNASHVTSTNVPGGPVVDRKIQKKSNGRELLEKNQEKEL